VVGPSIVIARFIRAIHPKAPMDHPDKLGGDGPTGSTPYQPIAYRSLRLERPISASTKEMIQNRITTWLSVQPRCSKW
jgi:hypothetical protein